MYSSLFTLLQFPHARFKLDTGQNSIPRMSCAKQLRSEVWGDPSNAYLGSFRVYNYMGVKLTRGRSTTKFCLLVTFEAHVGLRRCVNFYVPRNHTGKFCQQQSEVLSTSEPDSSVRCGAKSCAIQAQSEV